VSASEAIARLRELRAKATAGPWVTAREAFEEGIQKHPNWGLIYANCEKDFTVLPLIDCFRPWITTDEEQDKCRELNAQSGFKEFHEPAQIASNAAAIVAAMNSLDALLECAEALASFKITDETVRSLQANAPIGRPLLTVYVDLETALKARAALQALAEGGGE
jgi:hypothetical protein